MKCDNREPSVLQNQCKLIYSALWNKVRTRCPELINFLFWHTAKQFHTRESYGPSGWLFCIGSITSLVRSWLHLLGDLWEKKFLKVVPFILTKKGFWGGGGLFPYNRARCQYNEWRLLGRSSSKAVCSQGDGYHHKKKGTQNDIKVSIITCVHSMSTC